MNRDTSFLAGDQIRYFLRAYLYMLPGILAMLLIARRLPSAMQEVALAVSLTGFVTAGAVKGLGLRDDTSFFRLAVERYFVYLSDLLLGLGGLGLVAAAAWGCVSGLRQVVSLPLPDLVLGFPMFLLGAGGLAYLFWPVLSLAMLRRTTPADAVSAGWLSSFAEARRIAQGAGGDRSDTWLVLAAFGASLLALFLIAMMPGEEDLRWVLIGLFYLLFLPVTMLVAVACGYQYLRRMALDEAVAPVLFPESSQSSQPNVVIAGAGVEKPGAAFVAPLHAYAVVPDLLDGPPDAVAETHADAEPSGHGEAADAEEMVAVEEEGAEAVGGPEVEAPAEASDEAARDAMAPDDMPEEPVADEPAAEEPSSIKRYLYVPLFPTDIVPCRTPFDEGGEGAYFVYLSNRNVCTYLFNTRPVDRALLRALYQHFEMGEATLYIVEKKVAMQPDGPLPNAEARSVPPGRYGVFRDPARTTDGQALVTEYQGLQSAIQAAADLCRKQNVATLAGRLVEVFTWQ